MCAAVAAGLMVKFIAVLADTDYPCLTETYKCCGCKNSGFTCANATANSQSDADTFKGVFLINNQACSSGAAACTSGTYRRFSSTANSKGFVTPTSDQQESCAALKTWLFQDILVYIGTAFVLAALIGTLISTTLAFVLYVKTPRVKKLPPFQVSIAVQTSDSDMREEDLTPRTAGVARLENANNDNAFIKILKDFDGKLDLVLLAMPTVGKLQSFEEILEELNDYRKKLIAKKEENRRTRVSSSHEVERLMASINRKVNQINAQYTQMSYAKHNH